MPNYDNLITPPLILELSSLFEAKVSMNNSLEYYLRILADKEATQTSAWQAMVEADKTLGRERAGPGGTFRSAIRTDVKDRFPAGTVAFVNLKAKEANPPIVVGRDGLPLMDRKKLYPGCKVRASIGLYVYGGSQTGYMPGVSFGLVNVQWLEDGPRLKNARNDGSEFGPPPDGDLDDLL